MSGKHYFLNIQTPCITSHGSLTTMVNCQKIAVARPRLSDIYSNPRSFFTQFDVDSLYFLSICSGMLVFSHFFSGFREFQEFKKSTRQIRFLFSSLLFTLFTFSYTVITYVISSYLYIIFLSGNQGISLLYVVHNYWLGKKHKNRQIWLETLAQILSFPYSLFAPEKSQALRI